MTYAGVLGPGRLQILKIVNVVCFLYFLRFLLRMSAVLSLLLYRPHVLQVDFPFLVDFPQCWHFFYYGFFFLLVCFPHGSSGLEVLFHYFTISFLLLDLIDDGLAFLFFQKLLVLFQIESGLEAHVDCLMGDKGRNFLVLFHLEIVPLVVVDFFQGGLFPPFEFFEFLFVFFDHGQLHLLMILFFHEDVFRLGLLVNFKELLEFLVLLISQVSMDLMHLYFLLHIRMVLLLLFFFLGLFDFFLHLQLFLFFFHLLLSYALRFLLVLGEIFVYLFQLQLDFFGLGVGRREIISIESRDVGYQGGDFHRLLCFDLQLLFLLSSLKLPGKLLKLFFCDFGYSFPEDIIVVGLLSPELSQECGF